MIALCACLLLPASAAGTQIYRCEEPSGQPRFQQTPCAAGGGEVQLSPPAARWEALRPGELQLLEQRSRPAPRRKTVKPRDNRALERRCWSKRKRLEAVSAKLRRGYKRAQGERLRRQRDNLGEFIRRYCD
jgi:hypothetical protein